MTVKLDENAAYRELGPDQVLDAVESLGFPTDGRLLALNSYENRVYQVGLDPGSPLVAKFYRPGRWSDAAILEEHAFTLELAEREIPVVAPLVFDGRSLHRHGAFRFALYPRRGGRNPELDDPEVLEQLGRFMGRIHALGEVEPFAHRPTLDLESFGTASASYLLDSGHLPAEVRPAYAEVTSALLEAVRAAYGRAAPVRLIRLHGDAHPGNILWTDHGPHIVDFDDARMGPAIQDLWMFLSGDRAAMSLGLWDLLEGYTQFRDFDPRELHLVEALRGLRMLHYAAWLARRWDDPAFPRAFPWFNTHRYWEEHVQSLREQIGAVAAPPLAWD
ncbi:MAG: serine/threonine protein kinase [Gammaproteobacteria bacterium]|nr:serine/threonine protein kinase [Gammaproteobacteria bacterium]